MTERCLNIISCLTGEEEWQDSMQIKEEPHDFGNVMAATTGHHNYSHIVCFCCRKKGHWVTAQMGRLFWLRRYLHFRFWGFYFNFILSLTKLGLLASNFMLCLFSVQGLLGWDLLIFCAWCIYFSLVIYNNSQVQYENCSLSYKNFNTQHLCTHFSP